MIISISPNTAEELEYKLWVIHDSEEFLESLNMTEDELYSLINLVRSGNRSIDIPDKYIEMIKDEMVDFPRFLSQFEPKKKKVVNLPKNTDSFFYNDGGRVDAGYKGDTGDCVTRAISIATKTPYEIVYKNINLLSKRERTGKRKKKKSNSRTGVYRSTYEKYLKSLGWVFVPCMGIGTGCKVHLRKEELPQGVIIARLSKHLCCVIDGVINDTYDCSRNGTRCVYGYFIKK